MSTTTRKEVDEASEKVAFRQSTFRCAYCNSGAESFSAVFSEGSCVKCGGPAGVVVEISRPEDIKVIEKSVMIVYGESDRGKAFEIMKELAANNVSVIDPQVIADNEAAGSKTSVLAFLVDTTRFTLVIPSKEISSDKLVAAAVESGLMSGKNKIAPLYPDPSYQGRGLLFLDTISGVVWQDRPPMKAMGKSRFLEYLLK
ncbi:MAG: hypothetical protein WAV56_04510 [Microgenomates group bacterium]|mgnify:CR=1 FL=1